MHRQGLSETSSLENRVADLEERSRVSRKENDDLDTFPDRRWGQPLSSCACSRQGFPPMTRLYR
jgi:hypothetical protein